MIPRRGLLLLTVLVGACVATPRPPEVRLLCNRDYLPVLYRIIDQAREEVVIAAFLFKVSPRERSRTRRLLEHLGQARHRDVRVLVLLERSKRGGVTRVNRAAARLLQDAGIEVAWDPPRRTTHAKVVIVDRRLVLLGSHNLTESALGYNNEVSVLIRDPDLAERLRAWVMGIAGPDRPAAAPADGKLPSLHDPADSIK